jgi:glycosyltransferase involved in cell wall biosynthesis
MKKEVIIFMPSIEGGGVEKNLFIVTNFLAKKLDGITLITVSKKFKKKFNSFVKLKTLSAKFWDRQPRRIKYFVSIFLLIFELIKDRNKLVFAFQANIYCIIICKLFFIKIIVRSNSAPVGWSKNPIKRFIFKFFLNQANQVMVNSNDFKKDLKNEFNVISKCIYNPLNSKEIKKKSKVKVSNYFRKKKVIKILNIGRYTDQKDQITLLKSLKLIDNKIDFEAIIVGRGEFKSMLINNIKKFQLSNKVRLINFLSNPFPIIKECNVFVLSSKYEGLPNVLLESLVLKRFIISSDCRTGPNEILSNGKGGLLFKVGDENELAKKILFFSKNGMICNKKLQYAIKRLYKFDYNSNLNQYLNLVKTFL